MSEITAMIHNLRATADSCPMPDTVRLAADETERLNADLAAGKYRAGVSCGYCSHSGVLLLRKIEQLQNQIDTERGHRQADNKESRKEIERLQSIIVEAYDKIVATPELNMGNYGDDEVNDLNSGIIDVCEWMRPKAEKLRKAANKSAKAAGGEG